MQAIELVSAPDGGRLYRHGARAELADCAPSGRVRLDGIARWLQDAAYADVLDAGALGDSVWVVRRTRLRVRAFPRFGDAVEVATFCSGTGSLWAERRTTVTRAGQALVDAVALWVHLDADGRPRPLPDAFDTIYASAAAGRRVRARLHHPAEPPPDAQPSPWRFRAADLDLAGHVNNTVYWQVLEEDLAGAADPGPLDAEVEHRAPADAGEVSILRSGDLRWLVAPGGEVVASMQLSA